MRCKVAALPVSVKKKHSSEGEDPRDTPPKMKTLGKISMKTTKSGAGEKCLLLSCKVKACMKGVFLSQTPVPVGTRACTPVCARAHDCLLKCN